MLPLTSNYRRLFANILFELFVFIERVEKGCAHVGQNGKTGPPTPAPIECFWQPKIGGNFYNATFVQTAKPFSCPASVRQCYKFVCTGMAIFYVQRGCLSRRSRAENCQTGTAECEGLGGRGKCYRCARNRCNLAAAIRQQKSTRILMIAWLATALALVLLRHEYAFSAKCCIEKIEDDSMKFVNSFFRA